VKKFFAFMLCFSLVCAMGTGLVGCGKETPKTTGKGATPDANPKPPKDKETKKP
jgi:hypothetical protein